MRNWIIIIVITGFAISCNAQKKDNTTNKNTMDSTITNFQRKYDHKTGLEMYDFEVAEKSKKPWLPVVRAYNGWTILINSMTESGGVYYEYSPATEFQMIQKEFYPNGMLKQKSCFFQTNLEIGVWEYYDKKGNLTQKVDKDDKFKKSKVKLKNILDLLEREGWIDQNTGKGATEIIVDENSVVIKPGFNIMFTIDEKQRPVWYASVNKSDILNVLYKVDCETGEVTKEEASLFGYE